MEVSSIDCNDGGDLSDFSCLQLPLLHGWPRLQAWLVDCIKRAALQKLHGNVAGEIFLLRIYLMGEEATELALHAELMPKEFPAWLDERVKHHLLEERRHAQLFSEAIAQRGGAQSLHRPDWMGRAQIARWKRLAQRYDKHFAHGVLVPAYAIGLCAEQMAVRVLTRHCQVIGAGHALHGLLCEVLTDEDKHVRLCAHTLRTIVAPGELNHLRNLLEEVRRIDRSFGIAGALGLYLSSLIFAWWPRTGKMA